MSDSAQPSPSQRRTVACVARVGLLCVLAGMAPVRADDSAQRLEYRVKAAFLYNFARFVSWPAEENAASGPIVIGILGQDPFEGALEATIRGKTVSGRPFLVRRFQRPDQVEGCHLLFMGSSDALSLERSLKALASGPILTVGESEDFLDKGGMIGFVIDDQAVRIDINLVAARRARLELSSQLLRVARTVRSDSE